MDSSTVITIMQYHGSKTGKVGTKGTQLHHKNRCYTVRNKNMNEL